MSTTTYTNWCRMPVPGEIEHDAAAAAETLIVAPAYGVDDRVLYSDHGELREGTVLGVQDGDLGRRYRVRVTIYHVKMQLWCSGTELSRP